MIPEPVLGAEVEKAGKGESSKEMQMNLVLDGGFVVPENNAFGNSFRDYDKEKERKATVENFYRKNHIYQTCEFANKKKAEFVKLDRAEMGIWECCELLHDYVDESDPDLDEPQIEHLLQTAEAILMKIGFISPHSFMVMLHPSFGEQPQWSVVGDTYPPGCAFDENIVHSKYFKENPDYHPVYGTKLGVYTENCGLDKVTMSWGHDEYMYWVTKQNNTKLPPEALFIIRFHSFYAMHRSSGYRHLMNDEDKEMLKWVLIFNKYDLYSKSKVKVNLDDVKPYYQSLIEKYFPEKLRW